MVNATAYAALPSDPIAKLYGNETAGGPAGLRHDPITWLTAREAFPDSRLVVYGAPAAILLVQGYALNMSQITNDALVVPLAAACRAVAAADGRPGSVTAAEPGRGCCDRRGAFDKMTTIFLLPVTAAALALM